MDMLNFRGFNSVCSIERVKGLPKRVLPTSLHKRHPHVYAVQDAWSFADSGTKLNNERVNGKQISNPVLSTVSSYDSDCIIDVATQNPFLHEIPYLRQLATELSEASTLDSKVNILLSQCRVREFCFRHPDVFDCLQRMGTPEQFTLLCLPAINQAHVLQLSAPMPTHQLRHALQSLADTLHRVDLFYNCLGGIVGYQLKSLELITANMAAVQGQGGKETDVTGSSAARSTDTQARTASVGEVVDVRYHQPHGVDLAGEDGRQVGVMAAARGLAAMSLMAEIYPVGGAGDRLGLVDPASGEPLPAALLPYCGRSMMTGLVRDLQAREYLYFKLTGEQVTTPVAVMTSDAKGNHRHIVQLMEEHGWFGRGSEAFRLFRQPLVPVVAAEDGRWLLSAALSPSLKPGGHGAIWKLMLDEGVFEWLREEHKREGALIRQISNPLAGTDTTLLALGGIGFTTRAAYGFMSCERAVGAAEGMQVLQERRVLHNSPDGSSPRIRYEYGVTNVEYTEFERLGINDTAHDGEAGFSVFPANTNIMFAGLRQTEHVVRSAVESRSGEHLLPGLIFNLKKKVSYHDPHTGAVRQLTAGRMESTMQNIADFMVDSFDEPLDLEARNKVPQLSTFVVKNLRRKVTSSAKKKRTPGSTAIHQTPDGSFFDLQRNAWQLLQKCGLKYVPEFGSKEQYLARGPGFIFLFHPALGPLWDVVAQKIRGGALRDGAEMVLEVAEAQLENVDVDGSLLVTADNVMGHTEHEMGVHDSDGITVLGLQYGSEGHQLPMRRSMPAESSAFEHTDLASSRLRYSNLNGRVRLNNVTVRNRGVDWGHPDNVYWKHQVQRHEALRICLCGRSEFEARDVTLSGDLIYTVPDGYRMLLTPGPQGQPVRSLQRLHPLNPTWVWRYSMQGSGEIKLSMVSNSLYSYWDSGSVGDAVLDYVI